MTVAWQASLFGTAEPAIDASFTGVERTELADGAWVDHLPGWLGGADVVMEELVRTAPWRSSTRPMYDRVVAVPRLTAWWAWTEVQRADLPPVLEDIRVALSARYERFFTSCGCNLYRDGHDSVAWHGDRIKRDLVDAHVAIVSVGEPRKLLLRPRGGGRSLAFKLGGGDLFVMGGTCQRTWEHCVPKTVSAGPRLSITYRHDAEAPVRGRRARDLRSPPGSAVTAARRAGTRR